MNKAIKSALKDTALVAGLMAFMVAISFLLADLSKVYPILAWIIFITGMTLGAFLSFYFFHKKVTYP